MCKNCTPHLRVLKEATHIASLLLSHSVNAVTDKECCEDMRHATLTYWSTLGLRMNAVLGDVTDVILSSGTEEEKAQLENILAEYKASSAPALAILFDFALDLGIPPELKDQDQSCNPNLNTLDWSLLFGKDSSLA